jgi:hypothetical protein
MAVMEPIRKNEDLAEDRADRADRAAAEDRLLSRREVQSSVCTLRTTVLERIFGHLTLLMCFFFVVRTHRRPQCQGRPYLSAWPQ